MREGPRLTRRSSVHALGVDMTEPLVVQAFELAPTEWELPTRWQRVLEIAPSVRVRAGARTELTEEAERLVSFVARGAGLDVRWTA